MNEAVRKERTEWRDLALSKRHRLWGWDCPAIDIDFLMIEYNKSKVIAIVEYKNEHAIRQNFNHPSYKALIDLGNKARLPIFYCRYKDDFSKFRIIGLNKLAMQYFDKAIDLTELEWVTFLYQLRGYKIPVDIINILKP